MCRRKALEQIHGHVPSEKGVAFVASAPLEADPQSLRLLLRRGLEVDLRNDPVDANPQPARVHANLEQAGLVGLRELLDLLRRVLHYA